MENSLLSNQNLRSVHRDIGYLFVGLIISFCVSGIMLNHRETWNPVRYKYDYRKVKTNFHLPKESVNMEGISSFSSQNKLDRFSSYDFRDDSTLVILYIMKDATINLADGMAEINIWRHPPVSTQLYLLHTSFGSENWYIWYSDLFALGLIFIAGTGMFLMRGKNSFRKRGWLLAIAGIIIPIIALFLFSEISN